MRIRVFPAAIVICFAVALAASIGSQECVVAKSNATGSQRASRFSHSLPGLALHFARQSPESAMHHQK